jgi:Zinc finger, C2H2 type
MASSSELFDPTAASWPALLSHATGDQGSDSPLNDYDDDECDDREEDDLTFIETERVKENREGFDHCDERTNQGASQPLRVVPSVGAPVHHSGSACNGGDPLSLYMLPASLPVCSKFSPGLTRESLKIRGVVKPIVKKATRARVSDLAPELIHRCPFEGCSKKFAKKYNLKIHVRRHTGELPFTCDIANCDKRFMWQSSFLRHQRSHERTPKARRSSTKKNSAAMHGKTFVGIAVPSPRDIRHEPLHQVFVPQFPHQNRAQQGLSRQNEQQLPPSPPRQQQQRQHLQSKGLPSTGLPQTKLSATCRQARPRYFGYASANAESTSCMVVQGHQQYRGDIPLQLNYEQRQLQEHGNHIVGPNQNQHRHHPHQPNQQKYQHGQEQQEQQLVHPQMHKHGTAAHQRQPHMSPALPASTHTHAGCSSAPLLPPLPELVLPPPQPMGTCNVAPSSSDVFSPVSDGVTLRMLDNSLSEPTIPSSLPSSTLGGDQQQRLPTVDAFGFDVEYADFGESFAFPTALQ